MSYYVMDGNKIPLPGTHPDPLLRQHSLPLLESFLESFPIPSPFLPHSFIVAGLLIIHRLSFPNLCTSSTTVVLSALPGYKLDTHSRPSLRDLVE